MKKSEKDPPPNESGQNIFLRHLSKNLFLINSTFVWKAYLTSFSAFKEIRPPFFDISAPFHFFLYDPLYGVDKNLKAQGPIFRFSIKLFE